MSGVVCVVCPFADVEKLKKQIFLHCLLVSVCVRVCVSRMYVRAYFAILCVSADANVKHTK